MPRMQMTLQMGSLESHEAARPNKLLRCIFNNSGCFGMGITRTLEIDLVS